MRHRRDRGHRRRWKDVDDWLSHSRHLDKAFLEEYTYEYAKIRVHPWSSLCLRNSAYGRPRRKTKQKILSALIEIYEEWEKVLETLGQPYYLKIWLFEPRFEKSQVVCAIGDRIEFYNNSFEPASLEDKKVFPNLGKLNHKVGEFNWKPHLDEDHTDLSDVGIKEDYETAEEYDKEMADFKRLLRKPHKVHKLKEPHGEVNEMYFFKRGLVWTGEKEKTIVQHLP
jgi:hypothetical protein